MKVLLDENIPHNLRRHLAKHDVVTVDFMGWRGLKNGDLLREAELAGMQVFVTADQNLVYQQNRIGRNLAIVALNANRWELLVLRVEVIAHIVDFAESGSFHEVDCKLPLKFNKS